MSYCSTDVTQHDTSMSLSSVAQSGRLAPTKCRGHVAKCDLHSIILIKKDLNDQKNRLRADQFSLLNVKKLQLILD